MGNIKINDLFESFDDNIKDDDKNYNKEELIDDKIVVGNKYNNLFNFIKVFFTDKNEYDKIDDNIKGRHFFMINRFMSITQPIRSDFFNFIGINQKECVDFWQNFMSLKYKKVPEWIYIKTSNKGKKTSSIKDKDKLDFNKELIKQYCIKNNISYKDFYSAIELFSNNNELINKVIKDMSDFETILSEISSKNK